MKQYAIAAGLVVVVLALAVPFANAQRGQGRRGPGQGRGFDPAQMQERMIGHCQQALGATDAEWAALEPLVKGVMDARAALRGPGKRGPGAPGMGTRGPGRRGEDSQGHGGREAGERGPGGGQGCREAEALRTMLNDVNATDADVQATLAAYRAMQAAARQELSTARAALAAAVTPRQEAQLVLMGMLE